MSNTKETKMIEPCFTTAAAELLRLGLTPDIANPQITFTLSPIPTGESRARASVRYTMRLSLSWGGEPWVSGVDLIDRRGYLDVWTFEAVGLFMVKNLPGLPCVVNVTINDAARVPVRWSPDRQQAAAAKLAALVPDDLLAEAAAKTQSVAQWSISGRKTEVLAAAEKMVVAVANLRAVKALQLGVKLGQYQPPVDPVIPPDNPGNNGMNTALVVPVGTDGLIVDLLPLDAGAVWVAFDMVPGSNFYDIALNGSESNDGTVIDPYIAGVVDPNGVLLPDTRNDDFNGLNSLVQIFPATFGRHYVICKTADDVGGTAKVRVTLTPN